MKKLITKNALFIINFLDGKSTKSLFLLDYLVVIILLYYQYKTRVIEQLLY